MDKKTKIIEYKHLTIMYKQVGEKIYLHKETTNGQQHAVSVFRGIQVVQRCVGVKGA